MPRPKPASSAWRPGEGVPHPAGGYDRISKAFGRTLYYRGDDLHREDGPAIVQVDGAGQRTESYFMDNQWHRVDGPALVRTAKSGAVLEERFFRRGEPYRENGGPTTAFFTEDGEKVSETWSGKGNEYHRLDGPAVIVYHTDGPNPGYYIEGVDFTPEQFERAIEALESGAPMEWAIAYAQGEA